MLRDLLLATHMTPEASGELLRPYGFRDPLAADKNLQQAARDPRARVLLAEILGALLEAASRSADPDQAVGHLERFLRASLSALEVLSTLRDRPRLLGILLTTLGGSAFMAEILIRNPELFSWLGEEGVLEAPRRRPAIEADLLRVLEPLHTDSRRLDTLRVAKRREILHIGVRDLLRLGAVEDTIASLSDLAEVLIHGAYLLAEGALRREAGLPPLSMKRAKTDSGFVVMGLGKLGAAELNFSSDVDLLYAYSEDGTAVARKAGAPSWGDWARSLSRRVTNGLAESTPEGSVYRVDLRLRPEGNAGPIALPLDALVNYYTTRGATWERLALVRAWPVGGDRSLGRRLLARVEPLVYAQRFTPDEANEILRLKQAMDRKMAERGQSDRNVKLGTGGIREIELAIQALQVRHGNAHPALRERSTLPALEALRSASLMPSEEADALSRAYVFLRDVENKLQMVAGAQVHSLPEDAQEVRRCALRLGYEDEDAAAAFLGDYRRHTTSVHQIFEEVFARLTSRGAPP